jgi:hypothetical protein
MDVTVSGVDVEAAGVKAGVQPIRGTSNIRTNEILDNTCTSLKMVNHE